MKIKEPTRRKKRRKRGVKGDELRGHLLNNAVVPDFEAEEDPEWDTRVMVVATSSRMAPAQNQHPALTPHRSTMRNDSFSRSLEHIYKGPLHKEVLYSPVNMSRKSSSDDTDSAFGSHFHRSRSRVFYDSHRMEHSPRVLQGHQLPPDGLYPKPNMPSTPQANSSRERSSSTLGNPSRSRWTETKDTNVINTINSGWHSCFKNNNYIFVRNCRGDFSSVTSDDHDSLYRSYNVAEKKITVISPSCAEGQKLCVALQPEDKETKENSKPKENATTAPVRTQDAADTETTVVKNGHSQSNPQASKNSANSLPKKFKASKFLSSSVPRANETCDNDIIQTSTKKKVTLQKDLVKTAEKKLSSGWLKKFRSPSKSKQSPKLKETVGASTSGCETQTPQQNETDQSSQVPLQNGAVVHTSTPKDPGVKHGTPQSAPSAYSSLPYRGRHSGTPWRPEKDKTTVRRKLPYTRDASSPDTRENDKTNLDLLAVSMSSPQSEHNITGKDMRNREVGMKETKSCRRRIFDSTDRNLNLSETPSNVGGFMRRSDRSSSKSEPSISCRNTKNSPSQQSLLGTSLSPVRKKVESLESQGSQMEKAENVSFQLSESRNIRRVRKKAPDPPVLRAAPTEPKPTERKADVPVSQWLKELRVSTENECLNALQGKVISKDQALLGALKVGMAQETAEILREHRTSIIYNLHRTRKTLEDLNWMNFCELAAALCSAVVKFLHNHSSLPSHDSCEAGGKKISADDVAHSCDRIIEETKSEENLKSLSKEKKEELFCLLETLGKNFIIFIDGLILKQLHVVVETLEESKGSNCTKRAIFSLILLGQLGQSFCELLAKTGAVRALLCVCIDSKWRHLHASALRALTVICCVPAAVKSLEQSGGVECISDVLCDSKAKERTRSEAAGLIAQITAPWMENSDCILKGIRENGCKLIKALTDLAAHTESSEVMLLSSAALANLSFIESAAGEWMTQHKTGQILVSACTTNTAAKSLFIKDQVATVLANIANIVSCKQILLSCGSLEVLLNFLQTQPSAARNQHQLTACEQIQQKAAIALARLCSDQAIVNAIADMNGVQRIVQLCKDKKERNNSDSVLVACLAALRKIAVFRGKEEFKSLGALELIESRLWDTFLAYSSKQESYV